MIDPTLPYEKKLLKQIADTAKRIQKIYEKYITEITASLSSVTYKGTLFRLSDYPLLKNKVDAVIKKMHAEVYATSLNGIEHGWNLSNDKNDQIIDKRFERINLPKKIHDILFDPNDTARKLFTARTEKGLNLSDRVWNALAPFKKELEQSLGFSIAKGQSAVEAAKQIKQYLNQPDKLFRRVKNKEGKLVLSQAARNYHPGQGVYRSSYKNALRVTRTETNLAYRYADFERWQNMPFVTGIEIKTSGNHPEFDICDELKGEYPKTFKFGGWHPACLCYQVPKMANDTEFEKMEDAILAGKNPKEANQLTDTPAGFKNFISENAKRIKGWKNKPYWIKDNPEFVNQ